MRMNPATQPRQTNAANSLDHFDISHALRDELRKEMRVLHPFAADEYIDERIYASIIELLRREPNGRKMLKAANRKALKRLCKKRMH